MRARPLSGNHPRSAPSASMTLLEHMTEHGLLVEFATALASQAGLPIPAEPAMLMAGALAVAGRWRPELAWAVGIAAALLADHLWFFAGRWRGRLLLDMLCRMSLSPDSCVRQTDGLLARLGGGLLVLAKMIPGVAAVAIPTAAAAGMSYRRFLVFDALGAALWCGFYVGLGMIFSRELDRALTALEGGGIWALLVLAALLAVYVGIKAWQRARLRALYRTARISAAEVAALLEAGEPVVILDARSELAWLDDPRPLPASHRTASPDDALELATRFHAHTLISFCTCPNEAGAALLAQRLVGAGHRKVRVLAGGAQAIDALHRYA